MRPSYPDGCSPAPTPGFALNPSRMSRFIGSRTPSVIRFTDFLPEYCFYGIIQRHALSARSAMQGAEKSNTTIMNGSFMVSPAAHGARNETTRRTFDGSAPLLRGHPSARPTGRASTCRPKAPASDKADFRAASRPQLAPAGAERRPDRPRLSFLRRRASWSSRHSRGGDRPAPPRRRPVRGPWRGSPPRRRPAPCRRHKVPCRPPRSA